MFERDSFKAAFLAGGASPNSANTYCSFLNRIDEAIGGLDEAIEARGSEGVIRWAEQSDLEPFATYRSHSKSVLRRYLQYRLQKGEDADREEEIAAEDPLADAVMYDANFKIEKEMQAQVRLQVGQVESGLIIEDGGSETVVATGKIDIVARDANGTLVAIELKAGKCPAGALEQVLAYAHSLAMEREEKVRAVLIAGAFSDRQRAAAKRMVDLELKTYAYSLSFDSAD